MKSNHPKVLSNVLFKPMLRWVTDAVKDGGIREVCVVTGYKHQEVEEYLQIVGRETPELHLQTTLQTERKGTAHAVMMAEAFLRAHSGGHVLILNGDAPFLSSEIIQASFALHREQNNAVTVIAATVDNPSGYGRIVRENTTGQLCAIVEEKDADSKTKATFSRVLRSTRLPPSLIRLRRMYFCISDSGSRGTALDKKRSSRCPASFCVMVNSFMSASETR